MTLDDSDAGAFVAQMDEFPLDAAVMGVFSDWLQERGDERWMPFSVLASAAKVGLTPAEYAAIHPYNTGSYFAYDGGRRDYVDSRRVVSNHAIIDPQWANVISDRWSPFALDPHTNTGPSRLFSVGEQRWALARAWLGQDEATKRRWLEVTAGQVSRPTEEQSAAWLRAYHTELVATTNFDTHEGYEEYGGGAVSPLAYQEMMEAADMYQFHDDYLNEGPRYEHARDGFTAEFWSHYRVMTGRPLNSTGSFFSCSC